MGVAHEGRVLVSAVPYASGAWGTDYLTVSHGMRMGGLQITTDGRLLDQAHYIAACTGIVHGTEALILRVAAHRNRPTITWGDHTTLKPGDELAISPWVLRPVSVRLLHHSFRDWADSRDNWPAELDHALVADGRADPGFSGAPWVRDGRAYGLHKGIAKARARQGDRTERIVTLAEPVTRIKDCLGHVGYSVPEE